MLPRSAHEMPTAWARPPCPAAREAPPDARRLLREANLELARLRRVRGAYRRMWRRIAAARRRLALAAGLLEVPLATAAGALTPSFLGFPIPIVEGGAASPAFADLDGDLDAFVGERSGSTYFFANTGRASAPTFGPTKQPFGLANVGNTFSRKESTR